MKMRKFILLQLYFCSTCCGLGSKEVFPVYATPIWTLPRESRSYEDGFNYTNHIRNQEKEKFRKNVLLNNSFEVVVGSKYQIESRRDSNFANGRADTGFEVNAGNDTDLTDKLIMEEYDRCLRSNGFLDCLKYKTLKFVQDLVVPTKAENLSEVIKSDVMDNGTGLLLIGLPSTSSVQPQLVVGMARAAGSHIGQIGQFLLEQLDHFILRHGVLITVNELQNNEPFELDNPWVIRLQKNGRVKRSSSSAKLKRKELAIVFPLLVLFKFFKIKMLLWPIFFTVLLIKKILILALTVAPNLLGLLRLCRPPLGGFQTAGFIQEVDTRGEFSANNNYAVPYGGYAGYRQRDKTNRPDAAYSDY